MAQTPINDQTVAKGGQRPGAGCRVCVSLTPQARDALARLTIRHERAQSWIVSSLLEWADESEMNGDSVLKR